MCPLAPAPAAIYLPWPWQAPWNWLGFAAALAFVFWVAIIRRPRWGLVRPNIAPYSLRLLRIVAFNSLACIFILLVVVMPSMARNDAWFNSEFARLEHLPQQCNFSVLFAADGHHQMITSAWLGAALALNFLVNPIFFFGIIRHLRVPPNIETPAR